MRSYMYTWSCLSTVCWWCTAAAAGHPESIGHGTRCNFDEQKCKLRKRTTMVLLMLRKIHGKQK